MSLRSTFFRLMYPVAKAVWFFTRPKAEGVKCVVRKDGRILVVRHSYGSRRWNFPGGGMKRGETPETACRREIREETNLDIHELRYHGTFSWTREFKKDTIHVFAARTSEDFTIDGHELIDAQWVDFYTLPREEVSGVAHRVMRLIDADGV